MQGGYDCGGYVSELMRAAGVIPWNADMRAQDLFNHIHATGRSNVYGAGSLAFYGASLKDVNHVGFCLDSKLMLEAGGGDSTTVNLTAAAKRNAMVRLRLIAYRRDLLDVVRPDYSRMGMI